MSTKITLPRPEDVENFPTNPKAVIVHANSFIRVIERNYFWDKEKQRGCEKRTYLGYIVDNRFYSNEEYKELFDRHGKRRLVRSSSESAPETIGALETKIAAEFPIYMAVAKETGLKDDLVSVWGTEKAKAILSVAFHWLHTSSNAAYLYESWSENKLLPYSQDIPSKKMSQFFSELSTTSGWRKSFFNARLARLPDSEMLSFDATEIATEAAEISYAQLGIGKEGNYQHQLGLILLVGQDSHMPVLFRILPGNITDVSTVPDMLFRFDEITDKRRVFAAVLDRGYFSLKNYALFCDTKSRVIVAAKNSEWVTEAMEEAISELWSNKARIEGENCWGWTVEVEPEFEDKNKRKLWVHVYRSERKSNLEYEAFYNNLESFQNKWINWKPSKDKDGKKEEACTLLKSPLLKFFKKNGAQPGKDPLVQDNDAIDQYTRYFGMFCNVSTMPCSAKEAMSIYKTRDIIEKTFKGGKSNFDMDVVRAHTDETMEGRFIVAFSAMTILSRLQVLMKKKTVQEGKSSTKELPSLADEMTFNELKNRLSTPRVIYDGNGTCRWLEVTKKQHSIAARLGFPEAYKELPSWD